MPSILTDQEPTKARLENEADVIVTAVILGFAAVRRREQQPCSFDFEHPSLQDYEKDRVDPGTWGTDANVGSRTMKADKEAAFLAETQTFYCVVESLSTVLDWNPAGAKGWRLEAEQSPEGQPGAAITGKPFGFDLKPRDRHVLPDPVVAKIALKLKDASYTRAKGLYEGRGAYTGVVHNPKTSEVFIRSTVRVIDGDTRRWHPGAVGQPPWGLIRTAQDPDVNLKPIEQKGLGPLPQVSDWSGKRIGYIHGMCSAIGKGAEWSCDCVPYEITAGEETTKMASCFACTTFMYAAGYPPSSTHLGRGESWVPPGTGYQPGVASGALPEWDEAVIAGLRDRWSRSIDECMRIGVDLLQRTHAQHKDGSVEPNHLPALADLQVALATDDRECASRLFLDALTVHDSEWKRVERTLRPLCDAIFARAFATHDRVGSAKA